MKAAYATAKMALRTNTPMERLPDGPDGANDSLEAIYALEGPQQSYFTRNNIAAASPGPWWDIFSERPLSVGINNVYDWRLGVPTLLTVLAMRLTILGAIDPDFRNNQRYREELQDHLLAPMLFT
jgi:hypothetical protein